MGSPCEVLVDSIHEQPAQAATSAVVACARQIEQKFSRYRPDNIVARINTAAGQPVEVDEETARLLDFAELAWRLSDGKFDITSGALRRAWKFDGGNRVPTIDEVQMLLPLVGWSRVRWERPRLELLPGMEIDFGGIGKEYAADRAATLCLEAGVRHALIDLAGDVRAVGPQESGEPWRVGIRHPRKEGHVIAYVELTDGAVATSGDYERFFEIDGRRYCHILDPRTGMPATQWQSVSVVAPLCVVAGSCSTIAMLLGDKAVPFLRRQRVEYVAVAADGSIRESAVGKR
jgi:FAD:protein FMN transferase